MTLGLDQNSIGLRRLQQWRQFSVERQQFTDWNWLQIIEARDECFCCFGTRIDGNSPHESIGSQFLGLWLRGLNIGPNGRRTMVNERRCTSAGGHSPIPTAQIVMPQRQRVRPPKWPQAAVWGIEVKRSSKPQIDAGIFLPPMRTLAKYTPDDMKRTMFGTEDFFHWLDTFMRCGRYSFRNE